MHNHKLQFMHTYLKWMLYYDNRKVQWINLSPCSWGSFASPFFFIGMLRHPVLWARALGGWHGVQWNTLAGRLGSLKCYCAYHPLNSFSWPQNSEITPVKMDPFLFHIQGIIKEKAANCTDHHMERSFIKQYVSGIYRICCIFQMNICDYSFSSSSSSSWLLICNKKKKN